MTPHPIARWCLAAVLAGAAPLAVLAQDAGEHNPADLEKAFHLIGSDAAYLMVEPTLWRDGQSICSMIREQVPAQLLIDQGARPADTIPKPTTTAWQRFRETLNFGRVIDKGILVWIIVLAMLRIIWMFIEK